MRYTNKIYGIYSKEHDITFVMKEVFDSVGEPLSLEVVGFYYGEPNDRDNRLFCGDRKAEFAFDKVRSTEPVESRSYLVHMNITMRNGELTHEKLVDFVNSGAHTIDGEIELPYFEEL